MKTILRPHKVMGQVRNGQDLHALMWTTGEFAGIIFGYRNVSFREEDELVLSYSYDIYDVPEELKERGYDKRKFETELGDFMVQLLYYGLERDKLGFVDDNEIRENDSVEPDSQRGVLPEGSAVLKD